MLALLAMTESYVTACLIKARTGDAPLFEKTAKGVLAKLRGYAVIPIEDYEGLRRTEHNLERIGITLTETPEGVRWQAP